MQEKHLESGRVLTPSKQLRTLGIKTYFMVSTQTIAVDW